MFVLFIPITYLDQKQLVKYLGSIWDFIVIRIVSLQEDNILSLRRFILVMNKGTPKMLLPKRDVTYNINKTIRII